MQKKMKTQEKRRYEHLNDDELAEFIQKTAIQIAQFDPVRRPHTKALIQIMNKSIKHAIDEIAYRQQGDKT